PMIYFLHRLKRLLKNNQTQSHTYFRFQSWVAWQGKLLLDKYGLEKKDDAEDLHTAYYRYLGTFFIEFGGGGRYHTLFPDLDEQFKEKYCSIEAPIRTAIWACVLRRDFRTCDQFADLQDMAENWSRVKGMSEPVAEWGTAVQNLLFALAHVTNEEYTNSINTMVIRSNFILAPDVLHWFRGTLEKGTGSSFMAICDEHDDFVKKVPADSETYIEMIQSYCLFDHTPMGWKKIEDLIAKNHIVKARVDVKEYQRRANLFNSWYKQHGEEELKTFLADATRVADIANADKRPFEVVRKPKQPQPQPSSRNSGE
ncbi:hypothetical protein PFISCL1PPCAC_25322, partial [Pristionchus fissidentatus]